MKSTNQESDRPIKKSNSLAGAMKLKALALGLASLMAIVAATILYYGQAYPFVITVGFFDQSSFILRTNVVAALNSGTLVALTLLISAGVYLVVATTGYGVFLRDVTRGRDRLRWLSYGVSNIALIVLCALSAGFADLVQLMLMAAVAVAMAGFGYINQVINLRRKRVVWDGFNGMIWLTVALTATIGVGLSMGILKGSSTSSWLSYSPVFVYLIYQFLYLGGIRAHYKSFGFWSGQANLEGYLMLVSTLSKIAIALLVMSHVNSL